MKTSILIGVIVVALVIYFGFLKPLDKNAAPKETNYSADDVPAAVNPTVPTYSNAIAKYEFNYSTDWQVATSNLDAKSVLFGPLATAESGSGGVDLIGELKTGQTLEAFIKEFNAGIQAGSTSETPTTINGQNVVVSILPGPGMNSEVKAVAFVNSAKQIFNVYINYHTDGTDKTNLLKNFDDLTSTFHFVQ